MSKRIIIADTEGDNLVGKSTKLWIFGGKDIDTGEVFRFEPFRGQEEIDKAIEWAEGVDQWVIHNGLEHDLIEINKYIKPGLIHPSKVLDTLIISRLIHFAISPPKGTSKPHSLEAWGIRLGMHKGSFTDWSKYSQEMVVYWEQDLNVGEALYKHFLRFIEDPQWQPSIQVEHDTQIELIRQQYYGFHFNKQKAQELLSDVKTDMKTLEEEIQEDYPPVLKPVNILLYRKKKDGEEMATVLKAKEKYPVTKVDNGYLICYNYISFNPGSPKDRIEKLWEAGWKPHEKTKSHQKFLRKKIGDSYGKSVDKMDEEFYNKKKEYFDTYGWVVNEDNLKTLPETAPEGARKLARWLTLEGRRSSLEEWLGQVKDDNRIHGRTQHIGSWTGRGAHKNPNTGNISRCWPEGVEPRSPVEEIKKKYDTSLRSCWDVPEGSWLVGVDADGIQLRVLADWIWRHFDQRAYADTIDKGRKEDETDIHNVNKRALSLNHLTRDDAKTFIYAWALNAKVPRIASILKTTIPIASKSRDRFEVSIPGLRPFKSQLLPYIAKQGYFTGYDGRKVIVPSLHKTLAGILQNSETVLMKWAMRKWHGELRGDGIRYKPCTWVHDEWQTEVIGEKDEAEHVKNVQVQSISWAGKELGFLIPTPGSGKIGKNWAETH